MDYGRGDYFGELSFLRNAKRAVNVVAKVSDIERGTKVDGLPVPVTRRTPVQEAARFAGRHIQAQR